jgi:hypothetical protein
MPIRPTTLTRYGEKQIILMEDTQPLSEALQRLGEHNYQENQAYLVVVWADGQYQVTLFSELRSVVTNLGYDSFAQPLQALPIPFADRVVPTDTSEAGREIVDWVAITPQATVVIVEGDQVVGLFANPNRSGGTGFVDGLSLTELHGQFIQLDKDPRASFEARVEPPACPHCQGKHFFRFDPQHRVYSCPTCEKVVDL